MEAEPQAEAIRKRHLLFDRLARVDRGRTFVLDHLARQQMPAVGGGVEDDVIGPAFDAAFQHRLQRFIGSVIAVERQIVAKNDKAKVGNAQHVHQRRQAFDVLAICRLAADVDIGMHGFHQRRLAHAARAPQQCIVGGKPIGKTLGILDQDVAHPVDPLEQAKVDAADAGDLRQPTIRMPDKGLGVAERMRCRAVRCGRG